MQPDTLLRQIEPRYFVDYSLFSGRLRHYVAASLESEFKATPTDTHRRLYLLGVVKEEYSGYEDVGAFLLAFLKWRSGEVSLPLRGLLEYQIGEAVIDEILATRHIASGQDLFEALKLQEFLTADVTRALPEVDLAKVLSKTCDFFVDDCRRNQKRHGIKAYNKIKHGALVVPDASRYKSNLPSTPGAIFPTTGNAADENPYTLFAIPMTDDDLDRRQASIEFVQDSLRLVAVLYVLHEYPSEIRTLGFDPPDRLLVHGLFQDVVAFAKQVTEKE